MDSTTRFRFRDSTDCESTSDASSESCIGDDESKLESMTAKGIKRLCSELLELKQASDEDFHKAVYSNYSAFIRIFEEVGGVENELMQLKQHVSTQRKHVKDLMDGIYLEVLSKESIESIIEEYVDAEESAMGKLETHTNAVSETLDTLLLEHRLDEALAILEMEDGTLEMIRLEEDPPFHVLAAYNSAISERKSRLADQFAVVADHPRVTAPEFLNALAGLHRLGDSQLATQLLIKFYRSRLANCIHDLQSSKPFLHGTYIWELAKLVFSVISQAAKSFVVLYGEKSPYASELILWAREETKVFALYFHRYVKSVSEINAGLSMAVEAVNFAISFCSLLETQSIVLLPYLIKLIRPCMEEVLHMRVDHFKKVIGIFTASDAWVLGKYLTSGILKEEASPIIIGRKLECCLLTNSGRKFVTLFQAIMKEISPLVILQMKNSILNVLMDLFREYINILERAIPSTTNVLVQSGSRIFLAQTLSQQLSILANSSALVHIFSSTVGNIFKGIKNIDGQLITHCAMTSPKKELDNWIVSIQEAAHGLMTYFCQEFIYRVIHPEDGPRLGPEIYIDGEGDSDPFSDLMPSLAFQSNDQVLFIELRQLEKISRDAFVGAEWLVEELLRELMETVIVWLSNNQNFWSVIEDNSVVGQSYGFEKFVLDMKFLVEITKFGGYFSNNLIDASLALVSRMELAFFSGGLDPNRDVLADEWATDAATEAIHKLQEIEKTELALTEEPKITFEEDPNKRQHGYAGDSIDEDAVNFLENSMDSDNAMATNASEAIINAEQGIQISEVTSPAGSICQSEEEADLDDEDARSYTEVTGATNAGNATIEKFQEIAQTVQYVESPVCIVEEAFDEQGDIVNVLPKDVSNPYSDSIDVQLENMVESVIKKVDDDDGDDDVDDDVNDDDIDDAGMEATVVNGAMGYVEKVRFIR